MVSKTEVTSTKVIFTPDNEKIKVVTYKTLLASYKAHGYHLEETARSFGVPTSTAYRHLKKAGVSKFNSTRSKEA